MTVIDAATDSVVATIAVGDRPLWLATMPSTNRTYVANFGGSSISVIRDTVVVDVGDQRSPSGNQIPSASVCHGIIFVPLSPFTTHTSLFDLTGRRVLALRPGANDVSGLYPGVYFVRAVSRELSAVSCHKVVLTR